MMQNMVTQAIGDMAMKHNELFLETCEYLNISVCPIISESKDQVSIQFSITLPAKSIL